MSGSKPIQLLWENVLNFTQCLNKFNNSQYRLQFLRICLDTDIIPNFCGPGYRRLVGFRTKRFAVFNLNYLGHTCVGQKRISVGQRKTWGS